MTQHNMMSLFEEKIKYVDKTVPMYDILVIDSIEPTSAFVESVKELGIIHPPLLCKKGNKYAVLSGRRRVLAAKQLGYKEIRVRVVEGISYSMAKASYLTIAAQKQHKPNPIAELMAIKNMIEKGYSYDEIQSALGLTKQEVEKVMLLGTLPDSIQKGIQAGSVSVSTAHSLSKLDKKYINELTKVFSDTGRLKMSDVNNVKKVNREKSIQDTMKQVLPNMSFDETDTHTCPHCGKEI